MEISFIPMQILVHLHVNKTNCQMKDFALGLAFKQRRKATRKDPTSTSRARKDMWETKRTPAASQIQGSQIGMDDEGE